MHVFQRYIVPALVVAAIWAIYAFFFYHPGGVIHFPSQAIAVAQHACDFHEPGPWKAIREGDIWDVHVVYRTHFWGNAEGGAHIRLDAVNGKMLECRVGAT